MTVTVDGAVDEWGNPRLCVRVEDVGPLDDPVHGRLSDTRARTYSRFFPNGRRPNVELGGVSLTPGESVFAIVRLDDL